MISVVIPMYNAENTIEYCLKSIHSQTFNGDIEVIVVDDKSVDNSIKVAEEVIDRFHRSNISWQIVIHQCNMGVAVTRNSGLEKARGGFIALLDSDDEWLPNKLERQMWMFEEYPEIDFLGCSRNNEQLVILGKRIKTIHRASVKELLIKMYPQTSTAIFKRKLYDSLGGYSPMRYGEDADLWLRYCHKFNFYYSPESLVVTGGGKPNFGHSGLSSKLAEMQHGREIMLRNALNSELISKRFFFFIFIYDKIKYVRRIFITKFRTQ
ncbi:glycosyltransferase family 2 protein [Arcticibacter tournemirensis]